ncbi:hypothetical protein BDZ89DRAFT_1046149 [Hymenopellis radicata]|nr:hypothetical protein BDZ89DRAFT_1046149 [Hymenopellis radicata]
MSSASAQPTGPGAAPSALNAAPQATSSGELILTVAALSVQEYADLPSTITNAAHVQTALTTIPPPNPYPIPLLRSRAKPNVGLSTAKLRDAEVVIKTCLAQISM